MQNESLGHRLRRARLDAGLSAENAVFAVRAILPPSKWLRSATLTRIETGKIGPGNLDEGIVAALCEVYGLTMKDVAPELVDAAKSLSDLLKRSSAWIAVEAGRAA